MTRIIDGPGRERVSRRGWLRGSLAGLGGLGLSWTAARGQQTSGPARPASQWPESSSYCPWGLNGSGYGVYYYYCQKCPYPDGSYRGLSSPVPINDAGSCNCSQCIPAMRPMPSPQSPVAAMAAKAEEDAPLVKVQPGKYADGTPVASYGLPWAAPWDFTFYFYPNTSVLANFNCYGWTATGWRGARLTWLRVNPTGDPAVTFDMWVGQQINGVNFNWPSATFTQVDHRFYHVQPTGGSDVYAVLMAH